MFVKFGRMSFEIYEQTDKETRWLLYFVYPARWSKNICTVCIQGGHSSTPSMIFVTYGWAGPWSGGILVFLALGHVWSTLQYCRNGPS